MAERTGATVRVLAAQSFELSPPAEPGGAWTETVLYVFKGQAYGDGATPEGSVIIDSAGNLYGTTGYGGTGSCSLLGGPVGCGTVYELSPPVKAGDPWTEKVLYSFQSGNDGYVATGSLVFDKAGNLYGATLFGGSQGTTCDSLYGGNCGTIFELSPPQQSDLGWTERGAGPDSVAFNSSGVLFGAAASGGIYQNGLVFQLSRSTKGIWGESPMHDFTGAWDGVEPGGLTFDPLGDLYGSSLGGESGRGVVFRLVHPRGSENSWTFEFLYNFTGNTDGHWPQGGLTFDRAGNVFGTTLGGGSGTSCINGCGTVFEVRP